MKTTKAILAELGACPEAVKWAGRKTPKKAWETCKRGEWLLWIAGRLDVDRKLLVMAACACARTALKYIPDGEDRPRIAIETAEAWVRGEATIKQVRAAAYAAYAAYAAARDASYDAALAAALAAAYAAYAAAYAAYAAADAAQAAADAAHAAAQAAAHAAAQAAAHAAAQAAADAAHAAAQAAAHAAAQAAADAAYAAADAAYAAALAAARKDMAAIVRKIIPFSVIKKAIARREGKE